MSCGQLPLGGCYDPDIAHRGPCMVKPGETPEEQAQRRARRAERDARHARNLKDPSQRGKR